jgi:hypothetical protein
VGDTRRAAAGQNLVDRSATPSATLRSMMVTEALPPQLSWEILHSMMADATWSEAWRRTGSWAFPVLVVLSSGCAMIGVISLCTRRTLCPIRISLSVATLPQGARDRCAACRT